MAKRGFNRTAAEKRAEREIARYFASRRDAWSKQVQAGRISPTFRQAERDALALIIFRRAIDTAEYGLADAIRQVGASGVNPGDADLYLRQRVRRYSDRAAGQIVSNTVRELGGSAAIKSPDLRETRLRRLFGPVRAEGLAVNLTTDARSAGQLAVGVILGDEVEIDQIWITEDDGRECPTCGKLHKKGRAVWSLLFPNGPKAHPRCRCDLETVVVTNRRLRK